MAQKQYCGSGNLSCVEGAGVERVVDGLFTTAEQAVACLRLPCLLGVVVPIPVHELEAEVLSLGAEDRARILEGLLLSFESEPSTQKAWVAEALEREAGVHAGAAAMSPGSEALARVRSRIA